MKASESALGTSESPNYGLLSSETALSLSVGGALFVATIGSMLVMADTIVGDFVNALYGIAPILGMVVVGGALTISHAAAKSGIKESNTVLAVIGSVGVILSYGGFGAGVLTPYAQNLYQPAIIAAGAATTVIGLVAAAIVYSTDYSFRGWDAKAGKIFIGSFIVVAIGSFIPGGIGSFILLLGFALIILGFVVDLVYEIWQVLSGYRTPVENGFGLYVAFTGVFVHILIMALEAMGDS